MTRYLMTLCLLAMPAAAQEITARQVLDKVVAAYGKVKAVHMVAEREETSYPRGRAMTAFTECELAMGAGHRYFARVKERQDQVLAVSDGNDTWRAMASRKQWAKVSAASSSDGNEEEQGPKAGGKDLHDSLAGIMLYHYLALAKNAQDATVTKQQDYKMGHEKIPCYVIRAHTPAAEFELWVDRERLVVLQSKEKGSTQEGALEITMKMKLVELDQQVGDGLFHFAPDPGWSEVETLVLPGESAVTLTGEKAADFTLKSLEGETVSLRSLRGNVVVLDFWATWCGPCRSEFPSIEKLRKEFGESVRFYGISDEDTAKIRKFVEQNNYAMTMLVDGKRAVNRSYGIHAIPALFVIDRDSVVRRQFMGTQSETELRKAIRAVVEQK